MSFSSDIKQELNKANSLANKENVKFELIGYFISANISVVNISIHDKGGDFFRMKLFFDFTCHPA